ncbi:MAG: ABC transporter substrate-binding protein [Spirochaetaceae bacterium]|nr:ABC transporter substrate-binding protein [Spirochaetaceae bacterium]
MEHEVLLVALLPIESVAATDELTLMIKLSRPFRDTHRLLFDDPHIFARPPETFDTLDDANNVIGTGPFIMDEFVSGISVTFDRNSNYWKDDEKFPGNRLPYVDRLVMLVMGDQATRLAALRSAQVDLSGWNGVAQITSISSVLELQKTNPDMQFFPIAFRSEVSSPMNICAGGPLSDVRVRHALQMAIDLETINDNSSRVSESGSRWGLSGQRGSVITTPSIPGPRSSRSSTPTTLKVPSDCSTRPDTRAARTVSASGPR